MGKWYLPKFDQTEWMMLAAFTAIITIMLLAGAAASKRDAQCKELGGVPINGVCYEPTTIIQIPAE